MELFAIKNYLLI